MSSAMNTLLLIVILLLLVGCLFLALVVFRMSNSMNRMRLEMQDQKTSLETMTQNQSQNSKAMFEDISSHLSRMYAQLGSEHSLLYGLQNSMKDINSVMSNAKRRGSWGEYQMETLIRVYAGQTPSLYEAQFRLDNGKIADGAFHLPQSDNVLCIDSKFPMENYLNMVQEPEDEAYYARELRKNIKKHIEDVASKYINDQTLNEAILFIPSEAIYQYILAEQQDLFELALSKHVLLCSPTTLSGIVFILVSAMKDYYRSKNASRIEKELILLRSQMGRLEDKVTKASRNAALVSSQVEAIEQGCHQISEVLSQLESAGDLS